MHHISVTWHFRRCKLFFFWIPSVRRTICCHFHENRCYFIFSILYNLNIYLWPLKPRNFKSMCHISKIITYLESLRQAGWFDLYESDIQALLIFDPLITLWDNFDAPYLKLLNDASMASACFYVRTCRKVTNSKKIATIRDFHLPGSFLCLSTRLYDYCTSLASVYLLSPCKLPLAKSCIKCSYNPLLEQDLVQNRHRNPTWRVLGLTLVRIRWHGTWLVY